MRILGHSERTRGEFGWLRSLRTFVPSEANDVRSVGVGPLRILNEDLVAPGMGFGLHAHQEVEILSYVLEGELTHRDSMGNGSTIRSGSVQRISAGRGIRHSEFNPSATEPVRFLQIWLEPDTYGLDPSYAERSVSVEEKRGRLCLIASKDGDHGSIRIQQDARIYTALVSEDGVVARSRQPNRQLFAHVARGQLNVNGVALGSGDAAIVDDEPRVELSHGRDAEVLVFDLPVAARNDRALRGRRPTSRNSAHQA